MISSEAAVRLILERVPEFLSRWRRHQEYWQGASPGLCIDMAEFAHYVAEDLIPSGKTDRVDKALELIEELITKGSSEVQTAATTCFLESLLHQASMGNIDARSFVSFLGPESRAFCKAYDQFTGVHTEGLWDDE